MKNKVKRLLVLLFPLLALQGYAQSQSNLNKPNNNNMKTKKVLIVVTSTGEVKSNGKKTGLWIEEFAAPYYLFTGQGIEVTVASPKGGNAPIDPKSTLPDYSTETVKKFFSDSAAQEKLAHTLPLNEVNAADYDAVYYPGGTGPVWDLPENKASIRLIEAFYNSGKPTALVCHAPAALKHVKDQNGDLLVKGKKIAGYANSEEAAGQSKDMVPFSLEDMLKAEGADYVKGADWHSFTVSEGNLVTGQNPASSAAVAQKVIDALNVAN
jgi:putative intracellular protease/amidase